MTFTEFFKQNNIEFTVEDNHYGRFQFELLDYNGFVWPELERLADTFDGGTTWSVGSGSSAAEAASKFMDQVAGRLLRFGEDSSSYRHVRVPHGLVNDIGIIDVGDPLAASS